MRERRLDLEEVEAALRRAAAAAVSGSRNARAGRVTVTWGEGPPHVSAPSMPSKKPEPK